MRGACVLYSFGSYYWREATKGGGGGNGMQDNFENLLDATTAEWDDPTVKHLPFWDVIKEMSARGAMYDVKMMPDGEFRRTTSPPSSLRLSDARRAGLLPDDGESGRYP